LEGHQPTVMVFFPSWLRMFRWLGLAGEIGDGTDAAGDGVRLGKAEDAVLAMALADGDGGPRVGLSAGWRVAIFPLTPCPRKRARCGIFPASSSGWMTFQSAASQPTSRTLRGEDEGETGDGVVGESDMKTEKCRHSGTN